MKYFCDTVYGVSIEISFKLYRILYLTVRLAKQIPHSLNIGAKRLPVEKFKEAYLFFETNLHMLYCKSMLHFFALFLRITKTFFSLFSRHFSSYLISFQTFEIDFPKSADMCLTQTQHTLYCKINAIELLWFLISITPVFLSVKIWYPTVV